MLRASFVVVALLGCGSDPVEPPIFPTDYLVTYQQVRECRFSLDHDLVRMRILASPEALTPYTNRIDPFPTGAILIKEQFDQGDTDCGGEVIGVTVMQKLAGGSAPADLDWAWQEANENLEVIGFDKARCTSCHTGCGVPPEGYAGTCAVP